MCSLAHKTTPDTGCTQIKANVQRVPFLCVRAKAKLITKLTLCQTRNNETNRPDTRPGRRHTFLPFPIPIPLPLPIPLPFLNSSLSALQLLRLNCQHPGAQQQQRAVVKAVAPRAMPPHLQLSLRAALPRNHFVCVCLTRRVSIVTITSPTGQICASNETNAAAAAAAADDDVLL